MFDELFYDIRSCMHGNGYASRQRKVNKERAMSRDKYSFYD